jgi:hypothetical protein
MPEQSENNEHFKELRTDIREGFTTINTRIDTLVTRNEFAAELRRIDGNHQHLTDNTEKNFTGRDEAINKIITSNRWGLGFAVTIVATVVTVVNLILS